MLRNTAGGRRAARPAEWATLLAIVALAAYLRLANRAHNPGWYTDEGTHLDIAQHLAAGRVQYLAVTQSTLLFGRLPLFDAILAALLRLWGGGIDTLRALSGALGVISVAMLYLLVRRTTRDRGLALLAAAMLAIYPQAVLYSRFGFSYDLLPPLVLIALLGLHEYLGTSRRAWLGLAACAIGLGALSDVIMLVLAPMLILAGWLRRRRDAVWSVALALLPLGLYAIVMLATVPQAFAFDAGFTLSRLSGAPFGQQLASIAQNYAILLLQDAWIVAGLIGLFLLRPIRLRYLALLFLLWPIAAVGRVVALHSLSFYYMIPWLPLVTLGVAALAQYGAPRVYRGVTQFTAESLRAQRKTGVSLRPPPGIAAARQRRGNVRLGGEIPIRFQAIVAATATLAIVAAPFAASIGFTLDRVHGNFGTIIDPFLIDPADAERAAEYVNAHTRGEDVVIASPALAWLLTANTADFQMAIAATGHATVHLPANLPADRFAFDARYTSARFVVIDNLWRNWGALHMPEVQAMLQVVETWPLVFESGAIAVYRRPDVIHE